MERPDFKKIRDASLLQHDSTDCGAACLASVIRFLGGDATIEKIRRLSGTNQSGTSMLGLYQAARECGLEATGYEATAEDISSFDGVLILHLSPEKGYSHYVVCYGYYGQQFIIWDPASGIKTMSPAETESVWISHRCLALSPTAAFVTRKRERSEKLRWLEEMVRPEKEVLLASIFAGIVISLLGLVMALFTQKLIDRVLPSGDIVLLAVISVTALVLLVARTGIAAVRQQILLGQGKSFNLRIVNSFYESLLDLPLPFFETRKTGDITARLNDTMRIQRVISDVAGTYVIDLLVIIVTLTVIFFYTLWGGVITVIMIPLLFFISGRNSKTISESQRRMMSGYAASEGNFINSVAGIAEIKSRNWHGEFGERNRTVFADFQDRIVTLGRIKIKVGLLTGLAAAFYILGLVFFTSLRVMHGSMTSGELMAVMTLSSSLIPSVLNLALFSVPFNEAKVATERMFEFTRMKPEESKRMPDDQLPGFVSLSVEEISFRFPGQKRLLHDISLDVRRGRISALIGESGSGKSTIVKIIMRFYSPEEGEIRVNSVMGSEEVSLAGWRRKIGLVPQDIHVFNGTFLENILPRPDERSLYRLMEMTRELGLEPFIGTLPLGFATLTGEEGIKLSGGQKQVLAFLRALVQEPEILIIDEGTSAMDRDTEIIIMNILSGLKERMGILIVTHRFSLVKKICDTIYVIENGSMVNAGCHEELLAGDNLYRRYWDDLS